MFCQLFSMRGCSSQIFSFCFLLQPATSTLQVKSESAEEVTRVGTSATEGLGLVIRNRKSRVSHKSVIPVGATKGHCATCA